MGNSSKKFFTKTPDTISFVADLAMYRRHCDIFGQEVLPWAATL
jgi:hypothetical protein